MTNMPITDNCLPTLLPAIYNLPAICKMKKETVYIQHLAKGSLTTAPGDTILSYTGEVGRSAFDLCQWSLGVASPRCASFFLMSSRGGSNRRAVVYVQDDFTSFPGNVRKYPSSVVYEFTLDTVNKIGGYTPIIAALEGLRPYTSSERQVSDEYVIETYQHVVPTQDEGLLMQLMAACLNNHHQMFICLGQDELRLGDKIKQSRRLQALLHAIDALPALMRDRMSLAFAVDTPMGDHHIFVDDSVVVAWFATPMHCKEQYPEAICLDWSGENLTLVHGKRHLHIQPDTNLHLPLDKSPEWLKNLTQKPDRLSVSQMPEMSGRSDQPLGQPHESRWSWILLVVALLGVIAWLLLSSFVIPEGLQ